MSAGSEVVRKPKSNTFMCLFVDLSPILLYNYSIPLIVRINKNKSMTTLLMLLNFAWAPLHIRLTCIVRIHYYYCYIKMLFLVFRALDIYAVGSWSMLLKTLSSDTKDEVFRALQKFSIKHKYNVKMWY